MPKLPLCPAWRDGPRGLTFHSLLWPTHLLMLLHRPPQPVPHTTPRPMLQPPPQPDRNMCAPNELSVSLNRCATRPSRHTCGG